MNERTLLTFLGFTAIAFLGISLVNQLTGGVVPGGPTPTPVRENAAANACGGKLDTRVKITAPSPVDFNLAYQDYVSGRRAKEGDPIEFITLNPENKEFVLVKRNVMVEDYKVAGTLGHEEQFLAQHSVLVGEASGGEATGKPVYFMWMNFKGEQMWMIALVLKEK